MPLPPPPGATETCDTAGVLGPAVNVVASLQAAIALRILVGQSQQVDRKLHIVDVWNGSFRAVDVSKLRESQQCPACQNGERLWLTGSQRSASTVLCGRNAVQITPPEKLALSLSDLAIRLASSGSVTSNPFLVRVTIARSAEQPEVESPGGNAVATSDTTPFELTIFPDGRAIIRGTSDPAVARTLYSRYVGT
jgi:adenylyltransferase/sulfurtransferase